MKMDQLTFLRRLAGRVGDESMAVELSLLDSRRVFWDRRDDGGMVKVFINFFYHERKKEERKDETQDPKRALDRG